MVRLEREQQFERQEEEQVTEQQDADEQQEQQLLRRLRSAPALRSRARRLVRRLAARHLHPKPAKALAAHSNMNINNLFSTRIDLVVLLGLSALLLALVLTMSAVWVAVRRTVRRPAPVDLV